MKVKIKRFCKRVLPVAIAVMALAAVFCIPVSAAGSGWGEYSYTAMEFRGGDASLYRFTENTGQTLPPKFITDGNAGISSRYKLSYPIMYNNGISKGDICAVRIPFEVTEVSCSSGDVYSITIENLSVAVDTTVGTFTGITLWFGEKASSDIGDSWYNFNYLIDNGWTDGSPGNYYFNDLTVSHRVQNDSKVTLRYVMVHFIYNGIPSGSSGSVTFSPRGGFHFGYGNPNSPEAPNYVTPDGGFIDDYISKEEEILNSTQGGQDEFNVLLENFRTVMNKFGPGMLAATWVFNTLLDSFTLSYFLLYFALLTGVAAFILGISSWIGRGTRSSSSSKGAKGKKGG